MKRKVTWLGLSFLLLAALLLTSCWSAADGETDAGEGDVADLATLEVGETFTTPSLAVTVSEVIISDTYEDEEPGPGMVFLVANIELKNMSGTFLHHGGPEMILAVDSEGTVYRFASLIVYLDIGTPLTMMDQSLSPGNGIGSFVPFSIPEGTSGLKILYHEDLDATLGNSTDSPVILAEWDTGY